mmetsp:Transcript_19104/g.26107  ORF Transcript_19104/g.26107 Transcript_19104/m.26107 type:complete len:163 (-) Transcript_19104:80-568(-)
MLAIHSMQPPISSILIGSDGTMKRKCSYQENENKQFNYDTLMKRSRVEDDSKDSGNGSPETNKGGKKVRFFSKVKVVLVPSLQEYKQAKLDSLLWWNSTDYAYFKDSVLSDIRKCLQLNSHLDPRSALGLLCQEEECFSPLPLKLKSHENIPIVYNSPVHCS